MSAARHRKADHGQINHRKMQDIEIMLKQYYQMNSQDLEKIIDEIDKSERI